MKARKALERWHFLILTYCYSPCISLETHQQSLYWHLNPAFPYTDKCDLVESSLGTEHFFQYNLQEQTRGSNTYSGRVLNTGVSCGLTENTSEAGQTVLVLHCPMHVPTPCMGNMPERLPEQCQGWLGSLCLCTWLLLWDTRRFGAVPQPQHCMAQRQTMWGSTFLSRLSQVPVPVNMRHWTQTALKPNAENEVAAAFFPNLIIHLGDILDINLCQLLTEHREGEQLTSVLCNWVIDSISTRQRSLRFAGNYKSVPTFFPSSSGHLASGGLKK